MALYSITQNDGYKRHRTISKEISLHHLTNGDRTKWFSNAEEQRQKSKKLTDITKRPSGEHCCLDHNYKSWPRTVQFLSDLSGGDP